MYGMRDAVYTIIDLSAYLLSPVKKLLKDRAMSPIFVSLVVVLTVCAQ